VVGLAVVPAARAAVGRAAVLVAAVAAQWRIAVSKFSFDLRSKLKGHPRLPPQVHSGKSSVAGS